MRANIRVKPGQSFKKTLEETLAVIKAESGLAKLTREVCYAQAPFLPPYPSCDVTIISQVTLMS